MIARLRIAAAGPLTTLQDMGRRGFLRFGVSGSGPVDRPGFAGARAALGAAAGPVAIEISMGGLVLECTEGAVAFALAGPGFDASLDGVRIGSWAAGTLAANQRLVVRDSGGRWGNLALAGTIECPHWLGSAATLARAGLGGGHVRSGDVLAVAGAVAGGAVRMLPPPMREDGPVRVVIGPQQRYFAPETLRALFESDFEPTAAFDRMGMQLDGPALRPLALDMLSAPLVRGSVQVNGDGVATVLLADHQPTGGYPRIATVISADLDRLAQMPQGNAFRFEAVEVETAITIARAKAAATEKWLSSLASTTGSLEDRLFGSNLIGGVVDAGEG